MWRFITSTLIVMMALGGCVPIPGGIEESTLDDKLMRDVPISATGAITILPRYSGTGELCNGTDKLCICLTEKLQESKLASRYYPEAKFRDALFPWFEHGWVPRERDFLTALTNKPLVSASVAATGVRYLVLLEGSVSARESAPGHGLSVRSESASLKATVLDLQELQSLGTLQGRVSGMEYPLLILPARIYAPTISEICDKVGDRLVAFLAGAETP
jgi:hypothetical protein